MTNTTPADFDKEKDKRMTLLINHITDIVRNKKELIQAELLVNPNKSVILLNEHELSDSHPILKYLNLHCYPHYLPSWGFNDYELFNYNSGLDKADITDKDRLFSPYYVVLKEKITEILQINKKYYLYFTVERGLRHIRILLS